MNEKAKEARRLYMSEWRKKNKDYYNQYQRDWKKNNPDKVRKHNETYWSKKATE